MRVNRRRGSSFHLFISQPLKRISKEPPFLNSFKNPRLLPSLLYTNTLRLLQIDDLEREREGEAEKSDGVWAKFFIRRSLSIRFSCNLVPGLFVIKKKVGQAKGIQVAMPVSLRSFRTQNSRTETGMIIFRFGYRERGEFFLVWFLLDFSETKKYVVSNDFLFKGSSILFF